MIISRLSGGLGNQMFQYALGRALSIEYGASFGLDITTLIDRSSRIKKTAFRDYGLNVFNIKSRVVSQKEVPLFYRMYRGNLGLGLDFLRRKIFRLRGVEKKITFDPSIFKIGKNAYLNGVWQSEKYFKKYGSVIRSDFSLRIDLSEEAKSIIKKIDDSSVSLHIRRGDYVTNKAANNILGVLPLEYYKNAITLIKREVNNPTFFIFSDDIEWCKKSLIIDAKINFVSLRDYEDMIIMSKCKHNIIANSSYSWWGAWLNNNPKKIIIAPKKWYNDVSYSSKDLIPDTWITL